MARFPEGGCDRRHPVLLVLKQPDLGTALHTSHRNYGYVSGWVAVAPGLTVALLAAIGVGVAFYVPQVHILKSYQKQRLTSYQDPDSDPQGSGYQVKQSMIAVGSGGLWGGKGSQTHGAFLPIPQTGFIFAAFSEEHGFVGASGFCWYTSSC